MDTNRDMLDDFMFDETYDDEFWWEKPPPKQKIELLTWKCMDGREMLIKDMTDKHLENARLYSERRGSWDTATLLQKEQDRRTTERETNEFEKMMRSCPFCGGDMEVKHFTYESSPDAGPGVYWKYTEYRLVCKLCDAMGPVFKTKGGNPHQS